jgi:hypothetical protein
VGKTCHLSNVICQTSPVTACRNLRSDRIGRFQHNVRDFGVRSLHHHRGLPQLVAPDPRLLLLRRLDPRHVGHDPGQDDLLGGVAVHDPDVRGLLRGPPLQQLPGAVGPAPPRALQETRPRRTVRTGQLQDPRRRRQTPELRLQSRQARGRIRR